MNIKTFKVTADWYPDAQVTLHVDLDVLTPALAQEINAFWSGAGSRLGDDGGDVIRAVVRDFGATAIRCFMADGGASFGPFVPGEGEAIRRTQDVIDEQGEGWPDTAGLGIQILWAEVSVVGFEDVCLEAI